MNVVLWILQALLALVFAFSGLGKITQGQDQLIRRGMGYVVDFPQPVIKTIGVLEVLAAIGLVLPAWSGLLPIFTPLAATGLMALMLAAAVTHVRRREYPTVGVNVVLFLLAAVVAWGRFGPYSY